MKHELPFLRRFDANRRENLYVSPQNTNKPFPLCKFSVSAIFIHSFVRQSHFSNGIQAWVAYSQGRASAGSRAHLVIKSGYSIVGLDFYRYFYYIIPTQSGE